MFEKLHLRIFAALLLCAAPAVASMSVYMPPEHLAHRAELIVEGTVTRVAAGFDPEHDTLATYVTLDVEFVHRGPDALTELVIREPGGRHADLVHEVDAVPVYRVSERVLVFLDPHEDGALGTTGMFFGKFTLDSSGPTVEAVRDLEGQGLILARPVDHDERFAVRDLASVAASVDRLRPQRDRLDSRASARGRLGAQAPAAGPTAAESVTSDRPTWRPVPAEFGRLLWDGQDDEAGGAASAVTPGSQAMLGFEDDERPAAGVQVNFVAAAPAAPTRWDQTDVGSPITINVQRAGNPLNDGAAAVAEIQRAMDAWTDVPESRLTLQFGNTDLNYTGIYGTSPNQSYTGTNIVMFDDPFGDIADPSPFCTGVLAIGGYWRTGSIYSTVNNVSYHRALQAYVIFANGFECFLGIADNLAEVATHELGHTMGFGHSTVFDAIMRSTAYGNRGPRLGIDDRDGAHCFYPHTFSLSAPSGGEIWEPGSLQSIEWSSSSESGPDPGTVDIQYSTDGGNNWIDVIADTGNDGRYDWLVPDAPGNDTRVRVVRPPLGIGVPPVHGDACSQSASAASFRILTPVLEAGSLSAGGSTSPLRIEPAPGGQLKIDWDPSCSSDADQYAVYEGSLDSLRAGTWDHQPLTCGSADQVEWVTPGQGNRFYLVAPLAGTAEGSLGLDSTGQARPESIAACGTRETGQTCGN